MIAGASSTVASRTDTALAEAGVVVCAGAPWTRRRLNHFYLGAWPTIQPCQGSIRPGAGSVFRVTLPVADRRRGDGAAAPAPGPAGGTR